MFTGTFFAGRPHIFRIDYGFHGGHDVIFGNYSPRWVEMKKLMVQSLREYGSGSEYTEHIIKQEVTSLIEMFRSQDGKAFDPSLMILTAVVNALSASVSLIIT